MLSVVGLPRLFFPRSSFIKPRSLYSSTSLNYNAKPSHKFSSTIALVHTCPQSESEPEFKKPYLSYKIDEQYEKAGLKKELIPKHIAVILDGSRRWLKAQGKPLDYVPFFQTNALFADLCIKWGVGTATTFIYSYDNLQRGKVCFSLSFVL